MFFFKKTKEFKDVDNLAGDLAQQLKLILDKSDILDLIKNIEERSHLLIKEHNLILKDLKKIKKVL